MRILRVWRWWWRYHQRRLMLYPMKLQWWAEWCQRWLRGNCWHQSHQRCYNHWNLRICHYQRRSPHWPCCWLLAWRWLCKRFQIQRSWRGFLQKPGYLIQWNQLRPQRVWRWWQMFHLLRHWRYLQLWQWLVEVSQWLWSTMIANFQHYLSAF